ncbi:MAG TPA: protein-disulfide reductase DsbD domain-containing protein, partial [Candidatus Binataceae bacterium]|nr:protein-disulfide reductase DsbD domain-containing protein [Candidatus Binataceae bacterium]
MAIAPSLALADGKPDIVTLVGAHLKSPLEPGKTSTMLVNALVQQGWHINSDHPLTPDYIPTRLEITPPPDATVGAIQYPPAQETTLDFSGGEKLSVFSGAIEFSTELKAGADYASTGAHPATVTIKYQACNNVQCLRPTSVSATIDLAATTESSGGSSQTAGTITSTAPDTHESSIERAFHAHGSFLGFLFVLLGGLALNLTPCVYPLIGVTIAYFGNQGGGPRRLIVLASLFVLGIALMFSSVGVTVALSGGLFGAA